MKILKVVTWSLLIFCAGIIFVSCRKGTNLHDFDVNQIIIGSTNEFTYDGNSHAINISYPNVDIDVTYSLENDKDNFLSINDLPTINHGTYKLFYRISADGYRTYTSSETLKLTINPRTLQIYMEDYIWIKNNPQNNLSVGYTSVGIVNNDDIGLTFSFGDDFDAKNTQYGDVYDITCSISNSNYILEAQPAKLYVKDYVSLTDSEGSLKTYYSTIQDAINNAEDGDIIVLNDNVVVSESVFVDKEIIIDGQNNFQILAATMFTNGSYQGEEVDSLFILKHENAHLTLKDVTLDGSNVVRGVSVFEGRVDFDNAIIIDEKETD